MIRRRHMLKEERPIGRQRRALDTVVAYGLILAFSFNLISCDSAAPKPAQPATSSATPYSGATSTPTTGDCVDTNSCPQASDVNIQSGDLTAIAGTPVSWSFMATSSYYPNRTFTVFSIVPAAKPAAMTVSGNESASPSISWTPTTSDAASGSIAVKARDMTRCRIMETSNSATCDNFASQLSNYDTSKTFQWTLTGGTGAGTGETSLIGGMLPMLLPMMISLVTRQPMMMGGMGTMMMGNGMGLSGMPMQTMQTMPMQYQQQYMPAQTTQYMPAQTMQYQQYMPAQTTQYPLQQTYPRTY